MNLARRITDAGDNYVRVGSDVSYGQAFFGLRKISVTNYLLCSYASTTDWYSEILFAHGLRVQLSSY